MVSPLGQRPLPVANSLNALVTKGPSLATHRFLRSSASPFIDNEVVVIAGEAVELMHQDNVKLFGPGRSYHLLKLGAFIGPGIFTRLNKLPYHLPALALGMITASLQLKGDGEVFFGLPFCGYPGIDTALGGVSFLTRHDSCPPQSPRPAPALMDPWEGSPEPGHPLCDLAACHSTQNLTWGFRPSSEPLTSPSVGIPSSEHCQKGLSSNGMRVLVGIR